MKLKNMVLCGVIIMAICCILRPSTAEAIDIHFNARSFFEKGSPRDKALCIGASVFGGFHVNTVRGIIQNMNVSCQESLASDSSQYISKISPSEKKIVYSFTHGGVEVSNSPDTSQHIFHGLLTGAHVPFTEASPAQQVRARNLPSHSFDFVFVNACHSGDPALTYSPASEAGAFQAGFNSGVYIACLGGNNGVPIQENAYCNACIYGFVAQSFAVEFFNKIKDERALGQNRTFDWIKDQCVSGNLYDVMSGGANGIFSVFPQ